MSAEWTQAQRDAVAVGTLMLEGSFRSRDDLHLLTCDVMAGGPGRVHNLLVALADLWLATVQVHYEHCPCGASENEHARRLLQRIGHGNAL